MNLSDLNLRCNPFEMITPSPRRKLHWSGLTHQKSAIQKVYDKAFSSTQCQIVLNWGPYGGGKTFAAYYFGQPEATNSIKENNIFVYVKTPKDGGGATQQLMKDIISSLSYARIKQYVDSAISSMGLTTLNKLIFEYIRNQEIADAIVNLRSQDSETEQVMHRFMFGNVTASELRKINLPKGLKSDSDYIKFVSGVLIAMAASNTKIRIFTWIDEMEDLVYYSGKNFKTFSQTLRDIVDTINEKLVLFLNFTLAESQEDTIRMLLGEALWSRINQKIRFKDLVLQDALYYCKEQIALCQIDISMPYLPYTEDAIMQIISYIPSSILTPREINKKCSAVLDFALEKGLKSISKELVVKFASINLDGEEL